MHKKLLLLGTFCLVSLFAFMQVPRAVLSNSPDRLANRLSAAAIDRNHVVNALAIGNGGNDFAFPKQQATPLPTATAPTSPLPTPTSTTIPAPTSLPPTGADLLHQEASLSDDAFLAAAQKAGNPAEASYLANGSLVYPVRLEAVSIDLDTQVKPLGWRQVTEGNQEVSIWQMVDKVAGWHLNSVVPGQVGNVVMSGHNNIDGSIFRNLHQLQAGDEVMVWNNVGTAVSYTVAEVNIVPEKYATAAQRAANAQAISTTTDERLTLITCWPALSNTHRVIVVAHPTVE